MKKISCAILAIFFTVLLHSCKDKTPAEKPSIIPVPVSLEMGSGYFNITPGTAVCCESDSDETIAVARYLAEWLTNAIGVDFPLITSPSYKKMIRLDLYAEYKPEIGKEGYVYISDRKEIQIKANTATGLFYGVQTLLQLLPPPIFSKDYAPDKDWKVPSVRIVDYPRYSWRGMHLDVSRHFFPMDFIKRYIDLIAMHKMNVFHWHLTDDNGWRIEIKKYPLLTGVSAWRVDREDQPWRERELQKPGEEATYGGYYIQEEIMEIIQYAAERHVTVIPEIEMPGHTSEVFTAYPEYSCRGKRLTVQPGSYWPNTDIFCAGKEETFQFLEDILTEVTGLFPSDYIHIGGDEANKTEWKKCPLCQKRMKEQGLNDEDELQSYFVQRIEKVLQSKGKKLIGWDEILEGGLAPEATVMSWRGFEGGIEAAKMGHDVVMCPTSHCYFDYYQANPDNEPEAIGGYTTLKQVYSFRPTPPVLTDKEARHILGAQGNVWTEYIATPEHAEYMALPRMSALAEVVWSPDSLLQWQDFNQRMLKQMERLDAMNVNYSLSAYNESNKVIQIHEHLGMGKSYSFENKPSYKYQGEGPNPLTDGKFGSKIYQDGLWVGIDGEDLDILVDLGELKDVLHLETHFLHDQKRWIFAPKEVTFSWSADGQAFNELKRDYHDFELKSEKTEILPVVIEFEDAKRIRYVKVKAESQGNCPEWHPGAGGKAWIFTDEIVIN
jgi:hexosaminidase